MNEPVRGGSAHRVSFEGALGRLGRIAKIAKIYRIEIYPSREPGGAAVDDQDDPLTRTGGGLRHVAARPAG
jgi:hypothetical protein